MCKLLFSSVLWRPLQAPGDAFSSVCKEKSLLQEIQALFFWVTSFPPFPHVVFPKWWRYVCWGVMSWQMGWKCMLIFSIWGVFSLVCFVHFAWEEFGSGLWVVSKSTGTFFLVNSVNCNEYFRARSCKVILSKAVKRSSTKSYCPQKKKSLSFVWSSLWNMPADSVSYNPILFVADGGPYDSRKLQNGRPKQRS